VTSVPLRGFTTSQSLRLWKNMNLFSKAAITIHVGDTVVLNESRQRGTVTTVHEVRLRTHSGATALCSSRAWPLPGALWLLWNSHYDFKLTSFAFAPLA
jgi:hypothetical protein